MRNLNKNTSIESAVKFMKVQDIGKYPTPFGGYVHMFYEKDKVVVVHYDADGEFDGRYAYDSLDKANIETSQFYY